MLTYEDCLAFADLTEEEVRTIARHRRVPQMLALELGHYLASCPEGGPCVERMLRDDIDAARTRGNTAEAIRLGRLLRTYRATRPRARHAA
jgi:hypothetical protein